MRPYVSEAPCGCDKQSEMIMALQEQLATAEKNIATMQAKLNTIASGAEVNVNADWTATSGDAYIYHKPGFLTSSATSGNSTILVGGRHVFSLNLIAPSGASRIIALTGFYLTAPSGYLSVISVMKYGNTRYDVTVANVGSTVVSTGVSVTALWI